MSVIGLCALGVGLAGCGLKGPLYLPTDPAAANRATLPGLLTPSVGGNAERAPLPASAGSAPAGAGGSAR